MSAEGTPEIADHRERHACVTGEVLPEAQARGRDALVATPDLLQLNTIGPHAVYAGLEPIDAMSVQIELDETCSGEIRREPATCDREHCRELRQ